MHPGTIEKNSKKCSSIYWRLTNIVRNVQKNVRIKKNAKDVISFHHYKNIESDSLETNRDSTKNITK